MYVRALLADISKRYLITWKIANLTNIESGCDGQNGWLACQILNHKIVSSSSAKTSWLINNRLRATTMVHRFTQP